MKRNKKHDEILVWLSNNHQNIKLPGKLIFGAIEPKYLREGIDAVIENEGIKKIILIDPDIPNLSRLISKIAKCKKIGLNEANWNGNQYLDNEIILITEQTDYDSLLIEQKVRIYHYNSSNDPKTLKLDLFMRKQQEK